jgi:hypothetical protein
MGEAATITAVQAALDHHGIEDTVGGLAMARGGRRHEPHDLQFQVPRDRLDVKVHGRVNEHVLKLIDRETGSKIELEGNRIPITHSHDLIKFIAGDGEVEAADARSEEGD